MVRSALLYEDQDNFLTCYLRAENGRVEERCGMYHQKGFVEKLFLLYPLLYQYFIPKNNQANLIERHYNERVGCLQHADGRWAANLCFQRSHLVGRQKELIHYFMQTLQLTKQDLVILDRRKRISVAPIFEAQSASGCVIVHAEHFNAGVIDDQYIYGTITSTEFTNADKVDFFIVATDRQKRNLSRTFAKYITISQLSIPFLLGVLRTPPTEQHPFSMITASRFVIEAYII